MDVGIDVGIKMFHYQVFKGSYRLNKGAATKGMGDGFIGTQIHLPTPNIKFLLGFGPLYFENV